jgi:ATP-dependent Clp protease adaptor protein ClpS
VNVVEVEKNKVGKVDNDSHELMLEAKAEVKQPSMYQVFMHNDDFTPMEFVVAVLEMYFNMDRAIATNTMYQVHMKGKASCGVYTMDIAETKVDQVVHYARRHEHPLMCSIEAM